MTARRTLWLLLAGFASAGANLLSVVISRFLFRFMHSTSEFGLAVGAALEPTSTPFLVAAYVTVPLLSIAYVAPVFRHQWDQPLTAKVGRRLRSAPAAYALFGFLPWAFNVVFSIGTTVYVFGTWSPELVTQHIISPLMAGLLASVFTFLICDAIVRTQMVPYVYGHYRLPIEPGAWTLDVGGRLVMMAVVIGFSPVFTMLGLVVAARDRIDSGLPIAEAFGILSGASDRVAMLFGVLSVAYTWLLARSLSRPLRGLVTAVERIEEGALDERVTIGSDDEIGRLANAVNSLAQTLGERSHILSTFGRIVEPEVRDRLLAGDADLSGRRKAVTVLFVDLRDFTGFAERTEPQVVVETLNAFFTDMTDWVRDCGGTVDKFIGDALLAVFGLFDEDEGSDRRSAAAALRCARGIPERLSALNERLAPTEVEIAVRVSVHGGDVIAAVVGATDRHEYTVIGDAVNVAARLQDVAKQHGFDAVVSAATLESARQGGAEARVGEAVDVAVRGRSEAVRVLPLLED